MHQSLPSYKPSGETEESRLIETGKGSGLVSSVVQIKVLSRHVTTDGLGSGTSKSLV